MNFPVKIFMSLPIFILGFALAIPLTAGMDAMRQLLFPPATDRLLSAETEIAILSGLAVVFLFTARLFLARLERKAKADGKLSLRWQ